MEIIKARKGRGSCGQSRNRLFLLLSGHAALDRPRICATMLLLKPSGSVPYSAR